MANVDSAVGFSPVRHKTGGEITMTEYTIATNYNTAMGRGDVVEMTGTGRNIQKAAAGNENNRGVLAGVEYVDSTGRKQFSTYWAGATTNTNIKALVWDDPMIVFEVQCDSLAEGDVGAHADWDSGTPSATTGLSGLELASTATGTSGKGMKIMRLSPKVGNAYGAYAKAEVMFAEHDLLTGATGAGGV